MAPSEPWLGPGPSSAAPPQSRIAGDRWGQRIGRRSRQLSVPLAILLFAGGLVVLFATRWDALVGQSVQTTASLSIGT